MTVESQYVPVIYPVIGLGPYSFPFDVIAESDVVVTADNLVLNPSQYVVVLNGLPDPSDSRIYPGGTVTLNSDPGYQQITISRDTPVVQETDYDPYGPFPATVNEFNLDKLTLIAQELTYAVSQSGGGGGGDCDDYMPLAGGTWNLGALQFFPNDPAATDSSIASMGFINFFGINALRIQAEAPDTPNGIGYLLLTDQQNVTAPFVVGSKLDGWRVRNQLFTDPDAIVTLDYAESNFVQTTGAVWDADSVQTFTEPSGLPGSGDMIAGYSAFLGLPGWVVQPTIEMGFLFVTATGGPSLGANPTDGWEITGQVFSAPESIVTVGYTDANLMPLAGGTWGPDAEQVFSEPSTLPGAGTMTAGYDNVLGVPTWVMAPVGGADIGYVFSTVNGGAALGANSTDGWQLTNPTFLLGANIATVGYIDSLGFIAGDAPADGQPYSRQDNGWILATTGGGLTDAPSDGNTYGRNNAAWVVIPAAGQVNWGDITGNVPDQLDLQEDLDAKISKAGDTWGVDSVQTFQVPAGGSGVGMTATFTDDFFALNSWVMQPSAAGNIGYLFVTETAGASLGANSTDGWQVSNQIFLEDDCIETVGHVTTRLAPYLTSATAAATYLTIADASTTYLTQANASSTYLTQANASATYLTIATASATYLTQSAASSTYLTISNAAATYAPISTTVTTNTTQSITGKKTFAPAAGVTTVVSGGGLDVTGNVLGVAINATGGQIWGLGFNAQNNRVSGVLAPQAGTDAANRDYVDQAIANLLAGANFTGPITSTGNITAFLGS